MPQSTRGLRQSIGTSGVPAPQRVLTELGVRLGYSTLAGSRLYRDMWHARNGRYTLVTRSTPVGLCVYIRFGLVIWKEGHTDAASSFSLKVKAIHHLRTVVMHEMTRHEARRCANYNPAPGGVSLLFISDVLLEATL